MTATAPDALKEKLELQTTTEKESRYRFEKVPLTSEGGFLAGAKNLWVRLKGVVDTSVTRKQRRLAELEWRTWIDDDFVKYPDYNPYTLTGRETVRPILEHLLLREWHTSAEGWQNYFAWIPSQHLVPKDQRKFVFGQTYLQLLWCERDQDEAVIKAAHERTKQAHEFFSAALKDYLSLNRRLDDAEKSLAQLAHNPEAKLSQKNQMEQTIADTKKRIETKLEEAKARAHFEVFYTAASGSSVVEPVPGSSYLEDAVGNGVDPALILARLEYGTRVLRERFRGQRDNALKLLSSLKDTHDELSFQLRVRQLLEQTISDHDHWRSNWSQYAISLMLKAGVRLKLYANFELKNAGGGNNAERLYDNRLALPKENLILLYEEIAQNRRRGNGETRNSEYASNPKDWSFVGLPEQRPEDIRPSEAANVIRLQSLTVDEKAPNFGDCEFYREANRTMEMFGAVFPGNLTLKAFLKERLHDPKSVDVEDLLNKTLVEIQAVYLRVAGSTNTTKIEYNTLAAIEWFYKTFYKCESVATLVQVMSYGGQDSYKLYLNLVNAKNLELDKADLKQSEINDASRTRWTVLETGEVVSSEQQEEEEAEKEAEQQLEELNKSKLSGNKLEQQPKIDAAKALDDLLNLL
jgi:hypothetical protein